MSSRTASQREWRTKNRDRVNANQRRWRAAHKERVAEYMAADAAKHPEKHRARAALGQAVRTGQITRQPCEECGTTDKVEAHHEDYSAALDVRWLCRHHHTEEHL